MRHKKSRGVPCLHVEDRAGRSLFDGPLDRLLLPETIILRLSEEYFADPAPCPIHRNAVTVRVLAELQECLDGGKPLAVASLPPKVAVYLGAYPQAFLLCLSRDAL